MAAAETRSNGPIGRQLADRFGRTGLPVALGAGALLGAAAGAVTAMRSTSDDVISGEVSIDLLKRIELLTIRVRLHRT